ncbi:hypothetical protein [Paludibacterium denitrificans]|uniref:hypothetical protein n=1 Tax=Paludibacterium denitrificans TaxID=2675226 RepID=UPI001E5CC3E1|nr:hypothetical protein [Paludibacterium denitrificans]
MTRHSFHPLGLAALLLLLLSACGKAPTAVEEVRPVRYVIAGAGAEQVWRQLFRRNPRPS